MERSPHCREDDIRRREAAAAAAAHKTAKKSRRQKSGGCRGRSEECDRRVKTSSGKKAKGKEVAFTELLVDIRNARKAQSSVSPSSPWSPPAKEKKLKGRKPTMKEKKRKRARSSPSLPLSESPPRTKSKTAKTKESPPRTKSKTGKMKESPPRTKSKREKTKDAIHTTSKPRSRSPRRRTQSEESRSEPEVQTVYGPMLGPAKPELGPAKPFGPEKPDLSLEVPASSAEGGVLQRSSKLSSLRSAMPVSIQTSSHEHEQLDRNVALWLGRGANVASATDEKPTPARSKARLYDNNFVFGRQRGARR